MNKDLNDFLEKQYYSVKKPSSFSSDKERLVKNARDAGFKEANLKTISKFLNQQEIYTRFSIPRKKNFSRVKIRSWGIDVVWSADLLDLRNYSTFNNGYQYLFNIIDIFTRYAFIIPIKNKTALDTKNALENLVKTTKRKPTNLRIDRGKEFMGVFLDYCNEQGIRIVSTNPPKKAALAENLNKRVSNKIYKWMEKNSSQNWMSIIDQVAESLNSTIIKSIQCEPVSIDLTRSTTIYKRLYKKLPEKKKEGKIFNVGDRVRILEDRHIFTKAFQPYFTLEIFKIKFVYEGNPNLYILKDLMGEELRKT